MSLTNSFTGTGPLVQAGQLKSSRQDQICKPRLVFIALLLLPLLYKLARAASSGVERSALPHPLHQHQETGCAWGARVRTGGPRLACPCPPDPSYSCAYRSVTRSCEAFCKLPVGGSIPLASSNTLAYLCGIHRRDEFSRVRLGCGFCCQERVV